MPVMDPLFTNTAEDLFYIFISVYPLWIRCLQTLRKTCTTTDVDSLQIPESLKHALKFVPDLKFSTYSHFLTVNKQP
jgi:hypothetical protein